MFSGNFWEFAKNNERFVKKIWWNFRENLVKILGKCCENLGKILRESTNFLD